MPKVAEFGANSAVDRTGPPAIDKMRLNEFNRPKAMARAMLLSHHATAGNFSER